MNSELLMALDLLEKEKNIKKEVMCEALETAVATAYKKHLGSTAECFASLNRSTGDIRVYCCKTVVDEVFDDAVEISLDEALEISPSYKLGDTVEITADPAKFGRIAALTAKQMVVQKIREAERSNMYDEYSERKNDIMTGKVEKVDRRGVLVDLGTAESVLMPGEQMPGEEYFPGKKIKVYVFEISRNTKNIQLMISRTHPNLVRKLFEQEVPEIADGTVVIKNISREAGSRSKISVYSADENVDPVGSCVGPKGARVAAVVDELEGEKVDIVKYSEDPAEYIRAALSPASVVSVDIDEENKSALVIVPEYQLSLAIGKEGQNARLAARLTGWKIDIKSDGVTMAPEEDASVSEEADVE